MPHHNYGAVLQSLKRLAASQSPTGLVNRIKNRTNIAESLAPRMLSGWRDLDLISQLLNYEKEQPEAFKSHHEAGSAAPKGSARGLDPALEAQMTPAEKLQHATSGILPQRFTYGMPK